MALNAPTGTEGVATPDVSPLGGLTPLVSLRAHLWLALIVILLVTASGLVVAWFKGKPVYMATAVVYVAPRFANILQESKELEFQSNTQYREFVEQQARTVNRYDIVQAALQSLGERRALWQLPNESERRAVERLQAALTIRPVRETYLITVSLESTQAEGLDLLVNAIVQFYLQKSRQDDLYASDLRIASLRERRAVLLDGIQLKVQQRTALAQQLGVTTFADNSLNPYDKLLVDSTNALAEAQRRRLMAEAQFQAFDSRTREGQAALTAAAEELLAKDAGLNSLKASLFNRRSQLLQQRSGLGPENPIRWQIDRELKEIDAELQRASGALLATIRNMLLQLREAEVRQTKRVEEELQQQVASQRQQAVGFATRYNDALRLSEEIERTRKQLDAIDNRIDFLVLEAQAPGFVRLESPARPPDLPVRGGRRKLAMLFAVVALALGVLAPLIADGLDRRIRNTFQVRKLLGVRPLAALPVVDDDAILDRLARDQQRRLALLLERELAAGTGNHCLLLTAAVGDPVVTDLALRLASEFSRDGLRPVVVETNLRQSDPRYAGRAVGLMQVLDGEAELEMALVPAAGELPDRLASGAGNMRHLAGRARLLELLGQLRSCYDVILLDAAPLSLSADSELLASQVAVTLLIVPAWRTKTAELKRAAALLEQAKPATVGVIVTGLRLANGDSYDAELAKAYRAERRTART